MCSFFLNSFICSWKGKSGVTNIKTDNNNDEQSEKKKRKKKPKKKNKIKIIYTTLKVST